jgi:hypothetical protein
MKEDFLRVVLELPHGIPCHDAYSRLFRLMKPTRFQAFFDRFRAAFSERLYLLSKDHTAQMASNVVLDFR